MKKFISLSLGSLLTFAGFSQSGVSFTDAGAAYQKAKTTAFHFSFVERHTAEDIASAASYYTDYFTVEIADGQAASEHLVTIQLTNDTAMARRVITRFFMTLEVSEIHVEDKPVALGAFIDQYILL